MKKVLFLLLAFLLIACTPSSPLQKTVVNGSNVTIQYTARLQNGTIVDSSNQSNNLNFIVGSERMILGLENGIIGFKEGEERELSILPDEAFGNRSMKLILTIPRITIGEDATVGSYVMMTSKSGDRRKAKIVSMTNDTAVIDLNHPLAGQTIFFKVKVVQIH